MVDEGLTIVRAARARHDGARRNPWNDIECGSYYARALSSYALVNAYLGLSFDQRRGEIGFRPARAGDATYFWSAGRGWGEIAFHGAGATLSVKGGALTISALLLPTLPGRAMVDGRTVERDGNAILLGASRKLNAGDFLTVEVDASGAA
jgi:non-lysosomal glucosylceramidase